MTDKEMKEAKAEVNRLMSEYTRVAKDQDSTKKDVKKACDNAILKMYEYLDLQEQTIEDLRVYRDVWRR